mmetsp:Transcript_57943/g.67622  ORF Transcript_57943/g.67622 Transcript_57943/m.67622 type:complete len:89 (+) Transcript_57943:317-583(+)
MARALHAAKARPRARDNPVPLGAWGEHGGSPRPSNLRRPKRRCARRPNDARRRNQWRRQSVGGKSTTRDRPDPSVARGAGGAAAGLPG